MPGLEFWRLVEFWVRCSEFLSPVECQVWGSGVQWKYARLVVLNSSVIAGNLHYQL